MALGDPNIDPLLEQQLYGVQPEPIPVAPEQADPWSWAPPEWRTQPEIPMQSVGPDGPPVDPFTGLPETAPAEFAAPAEVLPPDVAQPAESAEPIVIAPVDTALAEPAAPASLAAPVDALTGSGGMPASGQLDGQAYAPTPTYQQAVESLGGDSPFDDQGNLRFENKEYGQRYLNELRVRDPAKFAEYKTQLDDIAATKLAAERQKIANADFERVQQIEADRKAAAEIAAAETKAIDAEAKKLADTKIDPTGGITGIKRVAGVIAAVIGGLVQARTGSARNMGLDALNQAIEQGIAAQKAELGQKQQALGMRRDSVGKQRQLAAEEQRAADVMRLATLKHAEDLLATEQQKFTPGGTRFLRAAEMRAQIAAEQAKQADLINERNRKRALEDRKQLLDEAQFAETVRNNRATLGLGHARLKSDKADREEAKALRLQDQEFKRQDEENERIRQYAIGGVPQIRMGADGKPEVGPDGKPIVSYDYFRNADGKPWLVPDSTLRRELGDKIDAAKQLDKLYARAISLRDSVGGESRVWNSAESQEMKQIEKEILLLKKKGTQGMSSDADMGNLEEAAGAKDLDSFRARAEGLAVARARTRDALNQALRTANYTGPDVHFPVKYQPESKLSADEERLQKLIAKPDERSFDEAVRREIQETAPEGVPFADVSPDIVREAIAATREYWGTGASRQQRSEIDGLGAIAGSSSPAAAKARGDLVRIAADAHTPEIRALARRALESADRSHLGATESTSVDVNSSPLPLPGEYK